MRRVLISFLGTNDYLPCHYVIHGQSLTVTRFVQTAIGEVYGRDWNDNDRVIVFLTKAARQVNWQDSQDEEGKQTKEGLATSFHRIVPHLHVETVDIPDGQSEADYWRLFDQVLDCIEVGDEIYFDITHGFRSIPMMALIILNYARVLKEAKVGKLLYGCFEALGPAKKVREMDMAERLAPVIDLTEMMRLFNWTQGVDSFLRSSDASLIKELTLAEASPVLRATNGQDMEAKNLKDLTKQLDKFTQSLTTVRGNTLADETTALKLILAQSRDIEIGRFKPLEQLLERIEEKMNRFSGDTIMDMYEAALWCLDHGLIQQGYTFLQENLVTVVCLVLDFSADDKDVRKMVSMAFNQVTNRTLADKEHTDEDHADEDHRLALIKRQSVEFLSAYREQLSVFSTLTQYRNNINHAGMNKDSNIKADKFQSKLTDLTKALKPFFESVQARVNAGAHVQ